MNELPAIADEAQDQAEAPAVPQLHRFGKRLLAHVGSPSPKINIWRDMMIAEQFMTAKYRPHQGVKECARRVRQRAV